MEENIIRKKITNLNKDEEYINLFSDSIMQEYVRLYSPEVIDIKYEESVQIYRDTELKVYIVWNQALTHVGFFKNKELYEKYMKLVTHYYEYIPNFKSFEEYHNLFLDKRHFSFQKKSCKSFLTQLLNRSENEFDYSLKSVQLLDKHLESKDLEAIDLEDSIFSFGFYIGEVLIKNNGAKWDYISSDQNLPLLIINNRPYNIYLTIYKYLTADYGSYLPPSTIINSLTNPMFDPYLGDSKNSVDPREN